MGGVGGGKYTRDRMKPLNVAAQFQKQRCCVHRNFFFVKKARNYSHGFCRILTVHLAVHSQLAPCNQYCGRRDSYKEGSEASRMQPSCTRFLAITNPTVVYSVSRLNESNIYVLSVSRHTESTIHVLSVSRHKESTIHVLRFRLTPGHSWPLLRI